MQRREHFGQRAAPRDEGVRARPARTAPPPPPSSADILAPVAEHLDLYAGDAELDRELEDWSAGRKQRKKRWMREPWRSFSIATGLAFAAGPFILPPEVADVANYVSGGLTVAALIAGIWRPRG